MVVVEQVACVTSSLWLSLYQQCRILPVARAGASIATQGLRKPLHLRTGQTDKPMLTVLVTLVVTALVVVLALNLHTPEKTIKHEVSHCHDILNPQFRREMGALLGPA